MEKTSKDFFQIKGICAGPKMLPIAAKCTKSAKEAPGDITKETRGELTNAIVSNNWYSKKKGYG